MSAAPVPAAPARLPRKRPRPRSRSARLVHALAVTMIALGALVLIDAGVTLVWQEPLTALLASLRQSHLRGDLRTVERAQPTLVERRALASIPEQSQRIAYLAAQLRRHVHDGSPVGRIVIPRIGADYVVVNGTDTEDLKSGPGIYPETNYPGIPGTTAIAGHRTTYLAPFRHIDSLRPGNHILVDMPYAHFTYTVVGQRVVWPTDVAAATSPVGYTRLVLSACTPLFSAEKRLLVFAKLTRTVPVGAARLLPADTLPRTIEPVVHRPTPRRLPPMLESFDPHQVTPLV